ncbi:MAG: TetR/AcrR family transcriptional regulator [Actinobacteria bacterium]|nr:TetR/AcrR family transcriptional regulator [Actinomycetota bacterium]MCA1722292.1 TetR/AcrR family transcriptional regulator [Actinomycetota bacterium]
MTTTARPRRELLLQSAADLFSARGYHAVGIDDIGAAAGISGPGVYRHFASKQALLEALCDRALSSMLEGAREIPAQQADPAKALEALVDLHVDFAVARRELLGVWTREQRALPEEVRRSLRRRLRAYEQPWREVLGQLREDLPAEEIAVAVTATLSMLNTAAIVDAHVPPERLTRLLRRMALSALLGRRPPRR